LFTLAYEIAEQQAWLPQPRGRDDCGKPQSCLLSFGATI